ncbi:MAG: YdjY domain-containing protein [Limisphaerales bacterium]
MSLRLELLLLCVLGISLPAQLPSKLPAAKPPAPPVIREVSPGVFQVGGVKLEKEARRASFPAKLNMTEGPLEYLLVTTIGKTHESILTTDIEPQHLQVAMLLLGAKGMQAAALTNPPPGGPITQPQAGERNPPLPGEAALIEVRWTHDGKAQRRGIEELVFNKRAKELMSKGAFTFTGSRLWHGKFIAQTEGSLIALITDPDAVFNNPRPNRDADDTWVVRKQDVPPLDTVVEVSITLVPLVKPAGQGK